MVSPDSTNIFQGRHVEGKCFNALRGEILKGRQYYEQLQIRGDL